MIRKATAVAAALLLTGCATTPPMTDEQVQMAAGLSREVFGTNSHFGMIMIPSDGPIADTTFIAQSKSAGPSAMARRAAGIFSGGATGTVEVAIGGLASAKTAQVAKDALKLNAKTPLPGLHLLFLGDKADADELAPLATKQGATFDYRTFP